MSGKNEKKTDLYTIFLKRILDFTLALMILILIWPILLVIATLVYKKLGSPIIYCPIRPGKNEKLFTLYKFRTMTNATDENGDLLPDKNRITKFGNFLRASSIDELPELINILKGDMSLVGPRPLSIFYLPNYSTEEKKRHLVRPGLTGLAQINGRNDLEWDKKIQMDIDYIYNLSLFADIKIILKTILKVLKRSDVVIKGTNNILDFNTFKIIDEETASMSDTFGNRSEIGSFYWLVEKDEGREYDNSESWCPSVDDSSYTFSGRAAIKLALKDILQTRNIRYACLPSYCCISMVQPFLDLNIKVDYYDISFEKSIQYNINRNKIYDVVIVMSYFGYHNPSLEDLIIHFNQKNTIVIEDITHSTFSEHTQTALRSYYVTSLRKWIDIPSGGWIGKTKSSLSNKPHISSESAVTDKIEGMKLKYRYLTNKIDDKTEYLKKQSDFENSLIRLDENLMIDLLSKKY